MGYLKERETRCPARRRREWQDGQSGFLLFRSAFFRASFDHLQIAYNLIVHGSWR